MCLLYTDGKTSVSCIEQSRLESGSRERCDVEGQTPWSTHQGNPPGMVREPQRMGSRQQLGAMASPNSIPETAFSRSMETGWRQQVTGGPQFKQKDDGSFGRKGSHSGGSEEGKF